MQGLGAATKKGDVGFGFRRGKEVWEVSRGGDHRSLFRKMWRSSALIS